MTAAQPVAVVIPAYNEVATIADVAQRALAQNPWVIVVDDGSTDGTAAALEALDVTVLHHPHNQGKAASLWRGISFALEHGAEAVISMDADGQHPTEDMPRLLAAARRNPGRIIIAARLTGRETVPRARRFANFMADFWISWASGYPIKDSQSGFRFYPGELLRRVKVPYHRHRGFVFESEILIEAARLRCFAEAVAIESIYPRQARRSYYRPFTDTALIVRMVAWKLLSRGLYPQGLCRSLGLLPVVSQSDDKAADKV